MKILTYKTDAGLKLGIVQDGQVYPANLSVGEFYEQGVDAWAQLAAAGEALSLDTLTLAPVVPNPSKILCVGLNYRRHAAESGMAVPAYPVFFNKFNNALAADGDAVEFSADWKKVDYESELVFVMGKRAKNVAVEDALDYVMGYCCANDVSERALQMRSGQWLLGKSLDGFLPLGPWLVSADEVGDPQTLQIRGTLNGEERQNSNTSDMIFTVAEIIAYATQFMTLEPGDIVLTGTPEGVVLGLPDKPYLQDGDEYVVEIEKLGKLINSFKERT